jgi:glycerophosphoryl diester phosphodiesterase
MKIFAHRGFSFKYPEATRAAYEGAIAVKVDGLECDIRLTRDRIPVCFHDRNLKRIAGISTAISKISLSELRQLTDVMTLRELIDLAEQNQKEILIETKHPSKFGRGVEKAVLHEVIDTKNVTIMSFSLFATLWLRKSIESTGYVIAHSWRLLFIPTKIVAIDYRIFNRSKWVRKRLKNKVVYLWTVNDVKDVEYPNQINGVISDRPDLPFLLLRPS